MPLPIPDDFRIALANHQTVSMPALPGRTNHLKTGVLVPLYWGPNPTCVMTLRSSRLRQHAGEVCFPGGRPDPEDYDLIDTARREAREELGIEQARILGGLSSIPLYTSDYRLQPFVAEVPEHPIRANPQEVAAVLRVELQTVLEQSHIDAIPWSHEGVESLSPAFALEDQVVYGATAHTFYELLVVAAPLFDVELPPLKAGRYQWSDLLGRVD